MKNLRIVLIVLISFGISSCLNGQFRKTVSGNGKVITEEREPVNVSGIKVSTGIDVFLEQGERPELKVEADENLHEYILTEMKDGVLHVYTDANIRRAKSKKVYVTLTDINSISTSSAGDVVGISPVTTDNLMLSASSAGDIKLDVYAEKIDVNISSSGDITLSGETDVLFADLSSAGNLNAYNLKAREADVSASSAGDADIFITEKLRARSSSAGDINYKGNPTYLDAHSSSAGGIQKR
ncbi:MAG TPA: head GIN domain-containing protein [Bacteroidales bacterium]|nr:head GIN domain-containing protein [Bacteroidales bacterium]HPI67772.1 head GIN domain-containing protein [Bacteroidales bacterium]HPR72313.1 head GIN domain-containing protein [Bacteroidales bacterium]